MSKAFEAVLYNGDVHLKRGGNHVYRVTVEGGKSYPCVSATGVVGMKDKSRALMSWQAKVISYVVGEGVEALIDSLPEAGVSFKFTEQAHAKMVAGLSALKRKCLKATDEIRDAAADEGTLIHDYIERWFKSRANGDESPPQMRGFTPAAKKAMKAFCKWAVDNDVELVAAERPVFSKEHFYTGQTDLVLRVNGEVGLWDVKTGKDLYADVMLQTAGYRQAWNEEAAYVDDLTAMPEITGPGGAILFEREETDPVTKFLTGNVEVCHFDPAKTEPATETFNALLQVKRWDTRAWKDFKEHRGK